MHNPNPDEVKAVIRQLSTLGCTGLVISAGTNRTMFYWNDNSGTDEPYIQTEALTRGGLDMNLRDLRKSTFYEKAVGAVWP
jgi:hypothetical protein